MTQLETFFPVNLQQIAKHIRSRRPTLFTGSQTSTVIPFENLSKKNNELTIVNLSQIPKRIEFITATELLIQGAVSWNDVEIFLANTHYQLQTYPTEKNALVLAGIATSCTGEKSFRYGNLRSQVSKIKYLNYQGESIEIFNDRELNLSIDLSPYHEELGPFKFFKNAPFPYLQTEADLMIGTEGQLGVITEAQLKVTIKKKSSFFFIKLPKWEVSYSPHVEIITFIQKYKNCISICEFLDSNTQILIPKEISPSIEHDLIFIEVDNDQIEYFFEDFFKCVTQINASDIFEIAQNKFNKIRLMAAQSVNEYLSQNQLIKIGTDAQVQLDDLSSLFNLYQNIQTPKVKHVLFGHIGDCHLHFNFLPQADHVELAHHQIDQFYYELTKFKATPFAEHGIGIIKQKYAKMFYSNHQKEVFNFFKKTI